MSSWDTPVKIGELAHARSGDKGDRVNIGVISETKEAFERLDQQLTADRVAEYFDGIIDGDVKRHRLENIQSFNYVATDALDGGGQMSLRYDTQGKTYAALLLECELPPVNESERGTRR
ncbi:AtuA-related protein [Salinigranum halophilum]|uniref:AtuA-related protein n=1 Tax=Salinigranum halophilum TaxID=2565931 RepID=UPI0010A82977|nr:hypothetical protein [Salinigranum halophilum]